MARPRSPRRFARGSQSAPVGIVQKKRVRWHRLALEFLENRLLLAQDMWTGGGDGKTWQDGSNWSLNAAPGTSDSAVINVASSLTILYNGTSSIESVTSNANAAIDITGGSLTVTSGTSQVSGALTVSAGATLAASGTGVAFTATGSTTIDGSDLYAQGALR